MRRNLLLILTAILMMCLPAVASAATCTLCGSETGSDDYLCTNCLLTLLNTKRESTLTITGSEKNDRGAVTVTWADEERNAPYTVTYELLETAPVPFGWTAAESTWNTSITLERLVPGISYVITVTDAQGNKADHTYFAPVPQEDTEIGAKIRLKPMNRTGRMTKQQQSFSAAEIAQDNGTEHGLYLRLTYSTLKKTRNYDFQIAVEAPNDFSNVIFSGTLELHHGKSAIPVWGFIPMDEYFTLLENYYGGIPTGEYDVTLYFNGNEVWSVPFTVSK